MAKTNIPISNEAWTQVVPSAGKALYSILAMEQQTLKDWFVDKAQRHIKEKNLS